MQYDIRNLDPFTHTEQDREKIDDFNFIRGNSTTEREKVTIDQTFCTFVAVGGKFLEKQTFKYVLKKIYEIRRMIRVSLNIQFIKIE